MMLLVTRALLARGGWILPSRHALERFPLLRQSPFYSASRTIACELVHDPKGDQQHLSNPIIDSFSYYVKSPQIEGALLCLV